MNKVILMGRLTRDPDIYEAESGPVAKYTLAVDRPKDGADFISCAAFGRGGAFARDYLKKGMKVSVIGHIQTGSYENREGIKIKTTEVVIEQTYFCESKKSENTESRFQPVEQGEQLPFN